MAFVVGIGHAVAIYSLYSEHRHVCMMVAVPNVYGVSYA